MVLPFSPVTGVLNQCHILNYMNAVGIQFLLAINNMCDLCILCVNYWASRSDWVHLWHAFQNNIPIFSPALTDGVIGDMLYLFSHENAGLKLDITEGKTYPGVSYICFYISYITVVLTLGVHWISDITRINNMAVAANNTGIIILGGGVAKHHICNANAFVSIFFIQKG